MRRALLALALLASLTVPAVTAQGASQAIFTVKTPSLDVNPLRVDLDEAMLKVDWEFTMSMVGSSLLLQGQSAVLHWEIEPTGCSAPGVVILGMREETIEFPVGWMGYLEGTSVFKIRVTSDAPGETVITCAIWGHASTSSPLVYSTSESMGMFGIVVAYDGGITAAAKPHVRSGAAGSPIAFPIAISNFANSETRVVAQLVGDLPAGWSVALPEVVVLESQRKGGLATNATMVVEVTPPPGAEAGTVLPFLVRLESGSIKDTTQRAHDVTVTLAAKVAGEAADIPEAKGKLAPGVGPLLAAGLLGLALLVRRRAD